MSCLRRAALSFTTTLTALCVTGPLACAPPADEQHDVAATDAVIDPAVLSERVAPDLVNDTFEPDYDAQDDVGDSGDGLAGIGEAGGDGADQSVEPQLLYATHATCDGNAHSGDYCAGDKISGGASGVLYHCSGPGTASVKQTCSAGCVTASSGHDDYCHAPAPPPPPTCTQAAFTGDYCSGDKVSHGAAGTLYRCTGPGPASHARHCGGHCVVAPAGHDDHCTDAASQCPHHSLLRWGLAPAASDELRCAGVTAAMISQTIGNAAASAGYHAQDGTIGGAPYTAAVDLRVSGMSQTAIRALLSRLADGGFAGYYRWPGHDGWPSSEIAHIHAVYAGVPMKSELRGQISDWEHGKNGLATHTAYTFWHPSTSQKSHVLALFNAHN